ncbi:hypothetical protein TIFTF001_013872 [Ficus carica]|uniref:Uncharacterized protein n=1 Tax=Ficus carica TaxID=3494 RepID=A0AA88AF21_FICCA|nr:hypothetical protein TIFTF001_013872 [Ficus carica]
METSCNVVPDVVEISMELRSSWFEEDGRMDHRLRRGCGDSEFSFEGGIVEYVRIKSPTLARHGIDNELKGLYSS